MRVAIVLAAVLSVAVAVPMFYLPEEQLMMMDIGANMTYFLVEDEEHPGHYIAEDLVNAELMGSYDELDLTYYYYSQKNMDKGTLVKINTIDNLKNTDFSASRNTMFIIHGWKNSYQSDVNILIKKAVLSKFDINVIVVDWSPIASRNYFSARWAVYDVGQYVGNFLRALESKFSVDLSKVTIAGHSLGAHVSGNAGTAVKSAVSAIIGMDPALPLFSLTDPSNRLNPNSAKFVHVIHTCGGRLGFSAPLGHVDHYPNGGSSQPGCGMDITCSCAHSRAYQYYAESVVPLTVPFVGTQCTSYKAYTNGECRSNPKSNLGGYGLDTQAKGLYYLNTNSKSPFAQS